MYGGVVVIWTLFVCALLLAAVLLCTWLGVRAQREQDEKDRKLLDELRERDAQAQRLLEAKQRDYEAAQQRAKTASDRLEARLVKMQAAPASKAPPAYRTHSAASSAPAPAPCPTTQPHHYLPGSIYADSRSDRSDCGGSSWSSSDSGSSSCDSSSSGGGGGGE